MDILSFIEKTNKAQTSTELFSLLEGVMLNYGFDRVLFSLMTEHTMIGKPSGHGLMRNYPEDWMKHYIEKDYQDIDPVRQYVLQAPAPFVWQDIEKRLFLAKEQKQCMFEAKESGLYGGVAFPMRGPMGTLAGVGAASSVEVAQIPPDKLSLLNAACQQFYVAYMALEKKDLDVDFEKSIDLTTRESEILKWCAQGKTTWEISMILDLSEAGVLFHMRNVMKKFSTSSRVYAVMQAVRMGLICL